MITTEYSVAGPAGISIAIVADLHEFEPKNEWQARLREYEIY